MYDCKTYDCKYSTRLIATIFYSKVPFCSTVNMDLGVVFYCFGYVTTVVAVFIAA